MSSFFKNFPTDLEANFYAKFDKHEVLEHCRAFENTPLHKFIPPQFLDEIKYKIFKSCGGVISQNLANVVSQNKLQKLGSEIKIVCIKNLKCNSY